MDKVKVVSLANLFLKKSILERYLLESCSGVFTGSIYNDKFMAKKLGGELGKFKMTVAG